MKRRKPIAFPLSAEAFEMEVPALSEAVLELPVLELAVLELAVPELVVPELVVPELAVQLVRQSRWAQSSAD